MELSSYNDWVNSFPDEQRGKISLLSEIVLYHYYTQYWVHSEKYRLRGDLLPIYIGNSKRVFNDELNRAIDHLTNIDLIFDWSQINKGFQRLKMQSSFEEDENEVMSIIPLVLSFREHPKGESLIEKYLNMLPDTIVNPEEFDTKVLPEFDKLIDILVYFDWIKLLLRQARSQNLNDIIRKQLPPLHKCLKDPDNFFKVILKMPEIMEFYEYQDGRYLWKKGKKAYLAGLAIKLLDTGRLKPSIKTNQDCARVFCPFFDVKFNSYEDKQFQAERAKIGYFSFLI